MTTIPSKLVYERVHIWELTEEHQQGVQLLMGAIAYVRRERDQDAERLLWTILNQFYPAGND